MCYVLFTMLFKIHSFDGKDTKKYIFLDSSLIKQDFF